MALNLQMNFPKLHKKGLIKLFGGVSNPFYFTLSTVAEGTPMKLKAFTDKKSPTAANVNYEMVPCGLGGTDGVKCIGLALQDVYNTDGLPAIFKQIANYHFANSTAQIANGMPIGLLTGQGYASLRNYAGEILAGDQLAIGPNSTLISATGAADAGDKIPAWAETYGKDSNTEIRIRFQFPFDASSAG